jgi:prepilin-type N-terminal cleavage/methylation domain-containing protein
MTLSLWNQPLKLRGRAGFTLVEILVAIVILGLLTLAMAEIFGGASKIVSQSDQSVGALDAGEATLGQIGLDISRMVLRDDVDYDFTKQTGNDRLSFYARTVGYNSKATSATSPRPLSVVSYQMGVNPSNATATSPQLNYGMLQIDPAWGSALPTGASAFTLSALVAGVQTQYLDPAVGGDLPMPQSYTTLAHEIIRFEYCFLLKTDPVSTDTTPKLLSAEVPTGLGTPPEPAIDNIAGLVVAVVVVDPRSRVLFPSGADVALAGKFGEAKDNQDIRTLWVPILTPATLKLVNVPAPALSGIHIYQRYFPFPW